MSGSGPTECGHDEGDCGLHRRAGHTVSVPRSWQFRAAVVSIVGALTLTACSGGTNAVDQTAGGQYRFVGVTPRGKTIPVSQRKLVKDDVTAPYLDGNGTFQLGQLKGQVVVLNFWATYCGPCVTESPAYDKIYRAMKAQGVTFVGIDVKEVSRSVVRAFVTDNSISYPIVYDQIGKTALQLGNVPASSLPSTVVIDREGKVAAVYVGAVQTGDLQPVLTSLVTEK